MSAPLTAAGVYTDLQGLQAVRLRAGDDEAGTLRFAAQQFEALFIQMMLKSAREAQTGDGLLDSEEGDFYQDLHDKQMGIHLAQGQGIGIAELLVQQLSHDRATAGAAAQGETVEHVRRIEDYLARRVPVRAAAPAVNESKPTAEAVLGTPQAFVEQLLPQAREAASALGVDPAVLLAQAALETGWGRAVSRHADGRSSHNLFNIKADARWDGERVRVSTVEYRDGVALRQQAEFRAYASYAESFADYVAFLRDSSRYRPALENAADGARYVSELARAGYATDPRYAEKINGIVAGEPLRRALAGRTP